MNDEIGFGAPMERRRFLMLGSTAIMATAASSLSAGILSATSDVVESTLPLLSIGYLAASGDDLAASSRHLVPATSLRSGDASLASTGVRLKVRQFSFDARRRTEPRTVGLNVLYRVDEGVTPFAAWTHVAGRIEHRASTPRFVVPVSAASPLELTVFSRAPRTTPDRAVDFARDEEFRTTDGDGCSVAALSVDSNRGTNKLRRGVYVLAIRTSGSQRAPHWPSTRFIAREGEPPVLAQASLAGYEPVPFDYIALSVDPA